jgi:8-oxo-dGTP diphosphatase
MNQLTLLNPEQASEGEVKGYTVRKAARAIVIDENNKIALLHVSKKGYYKLPGGGLEDSEDISTALRRECQEEIGCDVEVVGEIGSIVEYRKMFLRKQISYCYLAKVTGGKGTPKFTDEELKDGFERVWLPYEKALEAIARSKTTDPEGNVYIVPRDSIFLEAAKERLQIIAQKAVIMVGDRYLILLRAESETAFPGVWDFPGGKLDEGEDALQSLAREVKEETGLSVRAKSVDGTYKSSLRNAPLKFILYAVDIVSGDPEHITINTEEHSAYRLATAEEILGLKTTPYMESYLRSRSMP